MPLRGWDRVCGAALLKLGKFTSLAPLVDTTWTTTYNTKEPLVYLPGELGYMFGEALAPPSGAGKWVAPAWEHLTRSIDQMKWTGLKRKSPKILARTSRERACPRSTCWS